MNSQLNAGYLLVGNITFLSAAVSGGVGRRGWSGPPRLFARKLAPPHLVTVMREQKPRKGRHARLALAIVGMRVRHVTESAEKLENGVLEMSLWDEGTCLVRKRIAANDWDYVEDQSTRWLLPADEPAPANRECEIGEGGWKASFFVLYAEFIDIFMVRMGHGGGGYKVMEGPFGLRLI